MRRDEVFICLGKTVVSSRKKPNKSLKFCARTQEYHKSGKSFEQGELHFVSINATHEANAEATESTTSSPRSQQIKPCGRLRE